jgi:translation initiation factor 4B
VSESDPAPPSATASDSAKANPFGAARPIDTAAREKEIEEKRQLAIRQKKEADDKAREEKRAKETAEKAAPKEKSAAPSTTGSVTSKEAKETEPEEKSAKYEILRRTGGDATDETEEATGSANGNIVDDKAVKPKEVVRDPPAKAGGSWRKSANNAAADKPAGSTTEKVEEEGWSTVTKPQKNARRGGNPSRAIAS